MGRRKVLILLAADRVRVSDRRQPWGRTGEIGRRGPETRASVASAGHTLREDCPRHAKSRTGIAKWEQMFGHPESLLSRSQRRATRRSEPAACDGGAP